MIRHILKCTRGRRQAWKAFVAPFFMHNSCLFSFGWCKRECAEALLFPFNSVHDFLGEGKRNGKEEGGLSSKQAWNIHLFISFFFFFLASLWLCLDSISQMLFRALLPAPGAQCNSYLKNAYKKKKKVNCFFFSRVWKIQTNRWHQWQQYKWKHEQPAVNGVMRNKKERSQSRGLVIKPSHSGAFPLFMLLMIKITWDGLGQVCGLRL